MATAICCVCYITVDKDYLQLHFAFHARYGQTPAVEANAMMEARARSNRDNAAELYGDRLSYVHGVGWCETATGKPVVFTPHGWRVAEEVREEIDNGRQV